MLWPYKTPGISDHLFERLPGIPLSKKEVRLLLISALQVKERSVFWDIGAGTGTIPVEIGLLCPQAEIIAIERDEEVANLIRHNCTHFGVTNVKVFEEQAPDCFEKIRPLPDRICLEGGKPVKEILKKAWEHLESKGRMVATASNLEQLYLLSEGLAELQARNVEVVQSAVNRLESRGMHQVFAALDPLFILSGDKF
ncbi:precorrin-6Y C5,15-methyltransferase subunit CbiT [Gloeocapsa sp. PCC 73106]|uniref:precorrin-6Y C5,15-methyltransferase subunit CbiT n=1 Tax=Gloeocapsa sp. PCC 73106 TaxID=102232 RepID=UPI0002ABA17B|nr:precorrin-6Y C5,15-methyltransferase subunit CbiT [Gloeocapsa sp. PCC 73106]ELR99083.1 precorrin-6Y C5,15-methyltransferase (decarboxylating), CbiT subunit [Gloeocapsa sp. PCC 73106]